MMRRYIVLILSVLCLVGCKQGRRYFEGKVEPYPVVIHRFDQSLLELSDSTLLRDSVWVREQVERLYEEYPEFMPFWMSNILRIDVEDTAFFCAALPDFLCFSTSGFAESNQYCKEVFQDISGIEKELSEAFGRALTFYEGDVPEVYLFVSGFQNSLVWTYDGDIAVGADMYLGSDYPIYNEVVYEYQKQTMRKECIPVDIVSAWLFRETPYTAEQNRLIDNMLYRGKVMYVVSLLFPNETPWEVMGYTQEQWDWCERNERGIWGLMMDKKDLFRSESIVLSSYLNDGPFTSEVSQDSPGRLGTWMGWRIVERYMEENEEVTIQELLSEGDSQKILERSKYRP